MLHISPMLDKITQPFNTFQQMDIKSLSLGKIPTGHRWYICVKKYFGLFATHLSPTLTILHISVHDRVLFKRIWYFSIENAFKSSHDMEKLKRQFIL